MRLEGFELDERVKGLYQRYISGELTLAEVGSAIDELDDREFGTRTFIQAQASSRTCAD